MAKSNRAAVTRIATTVTARYYPTSGANDGFYLDGRLSGRREHRAADITLDREDRGFFYAVYAHLSSASGEDSTIVPVRKSLDKIMTDVKQPSQNIDTEINDLAECAVSVVGRMTLKHDGMRQPYFSGILVRDGELAAITMGNGCAYLYRSDILYPLTSDDYPLEAIDYAGKPVKDLDVYCAGVAGTVRYSNIAQLQMDDCLITCNREVMEALGQREILRMLYEAEDQADAAGMIITAAAAKLPGTPMQFMIGFVEHIESVDRTGRVTLARGHADTASSTAAFPTMASFMGSARNRKKPAPSTDTEEKQEKDTPDLLYTTPPEARQKPVSDQTMPHAAAASSSAFDQEDESMFDDDEGGFGDEIDTYGRGRRIAFYVIIAAICIACLFLIYNMLFGKRDEPQQTTTGSEITTTTTEGTTTGTTTTESETTGTTTDATTTTTAAETKYEIQAQHTVKAGETLWGLAVKYYGSGSQEYIDLIKDANDMDSDYIYADDVLDIPVKPD
jgi:LysM repeat protein